MTPWEGISAVEAKLRERGLTDLADDLYEASVCAGGDVRRDMAGAIAEAMASIREDVSLGVAGNIEADAVLLNVARAAADRLGIQPGSDQYEAFLAECDLQELIPSEAFER